MECYWTWSLPEPSFLVHLLARASANSTVFRQGNSCIVVFNSHLWLVVKSSKRTFESQRKFGLVQGLFASDITIDPKRSDE